jgi:hypothetical protein
MAPRKVIPIPEKTLRMLKKAIAGSVTTQATVQISIMTFTCRRSFTPSERAEWKINKDEQESGLYRERFQ